MNNLSIKQATNSAELKAAALIRFRVFCEEMGFLSKKDCPQMAEQDNYDPYAYHFITCWKEDIIGTVRLIPDTESLGFPIEKNIALPPDILRTRTVEISRGAILPKHRSMSGAGIKTLDYIYEFCKQKGFVHILAFANKNMYNLYQKLSMPIHKQYPWVHAKGYATYPIILRVKSNYFILKRKKGVA